MFLETLNRTARRMNALCMFFGFDGWDRMLSLALEEILDFFGLVCQSFPVQLLVDYFVIEVSEPYRTTTESLQSVLKVGSAQNCHISNA